MNIDRTPLWNRLLPFGAILLAACPVLAGNATYSYDDLNRLTGAVDGDGTVIEYSYDAAGNRTSHVVQATANLTLTLAMAGTGSGTVGGGGSYAAGAPVTLTATPAVGSTFAGWGPSPCAASFAMPATDLTCTATFTPISYTVTATAGANGSMSPASRSVAHGATTTFTVTPATGYSASVTGCGGSLSGTTYTTGAITAACTVSASFLPTVTVTASDASATEAGLTTGRFTFRRTGSIAASLTVTYSVSGTATAGSDYTALGTSVSFAAWARTATKTVTPRQDTLVEASETIILTLAAGSGYAVGTPASATVILTSDDVAPTVTVTASDASATEAGLTTGRFTFRRTGSIAASLTVTYSVSGTATAGSDYTALGTSVSFAAWASTATKTVTPLQDTLVEVNESIILTLAGGSGYAVGTPASGTVILSSDD
jgi:YD repeat-containing protein